MLSLFSKLGDLEWLHINVKLYKIWQTHVIIVGQWRWRLRTHPQLLEPTGMHPYQPIRIIAHDSPKASQPLLLWTLKKKCHSPHTVILFLNNSIFTFHNNIITFGGWKVLKSEYIVKICFTLQIDQQKWWIGLNFSAHWNYKEWLLEKMPK